MSNLFIGPSGIPITTAGSSLADGLLRISEIGLTAMEIGWVHGARTSDEDCAAIKLIKEKNGLGLTAHGSYYINLNAVEPEKIAASRERIIQAVRKSYLAGVDKLVFHAAFYLDTPRPQVLDNVITQLRLINEQLSSAERDNVIISVETTGKDTQFGDLSEVIAVAKSLPNVRPCIDFSHLFARSLGVMNGYDNFCRVIERLGTELGRTYLDNMHIHLSGIEYGPKGEKRHVPFDESAMDFRGLLTALKKFEVGGHLIVESPTVEEEALFIKNLYDSLS